MPDGEPGELIVRGPYTLRGYFRSPEHNARAFTPDGFYRSGDLLRKLPSGNYVVEGRVKDLINRGGEKISAEEVENLILAHPAVLNVACVPYPDPVLGERMCACLVLRDGRSLSLDELVAFLREFEIATFKLPERVAFFGIPAAVRLRQGVQEGTGGPAGGGTSRCGASTCTAIRGPRSGSRPRGPTSRRSGKYWGKEWAGKSEDEVVADVNAAGVEAVLVAFDIESVTGAPPCTQRLRGRAARPAPGDVHRRLGGGRPVQGRAGDRRRGHRGPRAPRARLPLPPDHGALRGRRARANPLFETIAGLGVPVMIDVGTTGMGAGMPGGLGARIEHARPLVGRQPGRPASRR